MFRCDFPVLPRHITGTLTGVTKLVDHYALLVSLCECLPFHNFIYNSQKPCSVKSD
jgi:hypothetical protein